MRKKGLRAFKLYVSCVCRWQKRIAQQPIQQRTYMRKNKNNSWNHTTVRSKTAFFFTFYCNNRIFIQLWLTPLHPPFFSFLYQSKMAQMKKKSHSRPSRNNCNACMLLLLKPDRILCYVVASKAVDQRIFYSSETSMDGLWGPRITTNCWVGN